MNNNLILKTLRSPFITQFTTPYGVVDLYDTTKNTTLSDVDIDNNFLYLKGNIIFTASTNGDKIFLQKINGSIVTIPITSVTNNITNTTNINNIENIDLFSPTNGQTIFNLSHIPIPTSSCEFFINGINVDSFIVNGHIITYTGIKYTLTSTDIIKIFYNT